MKCFFHEALGHWKHAARRCVIDNTSLARKSGSGKNAVISPEMENFSRQYGFSFFCHEIGHADRKAGNERGFWTVETNFFPGRSFENLEDMNRQALEWAVARSARRPTGKSRTVPLGLRDRKGISDQDTAARSPSVPGALQKVRLVRLRVFRRKLLLGARGAKRRRPGAAIRGLPENLPGPGVSRALSAARRRNEKQVDRTRRESAALAQAKIRKEADGQGGAIAARVPRHGRRISRLPEAPKESTRSSAGSTGCIGKRRFRYS